MFLKEYQGKELFSQYGIPIPHGFAVFSPTVIEKPLAKLSTNDIAIKAQTIGGGRGKAGLVKIVPKEKVKSIVASFFKQQAEGQRITEVLLEERIAIEKEWYLSLMVEGAARSILLLFSERGGMDIEDVANKYPKEVNRHYFLTLENKRVEKLFPKLYRKQLADMVVKLHQLMVEKDATLVEVNPLMLTKQGTLIAGDAKIIIDDNTLYRHPEFKKYTGEYSAIEQKARAYGLHYVELPQPKGNIAVIGNGAGLVMASLDLIYYYGGHPASFLDLGGGTGVDIMEKALEISLSKPGIRGVFINIFAGITRADEIAEAIVHFKQKQRVKIPFAIRMIGTEEMRAKKTLEAAGLTLAPSMENAIKEIIRKVHS